jgi:hypothetical protein
MIFLENSSQNARNVALETLNRVVEAEYFYLNIQALFNFPTFNIPEIPGCVCENIHSNSVSNMHILTINIPTLNIHVPILIQPKRYSIFRFQPDFAWERTCPRTPRAILAA